MTIPWKAIGKLLGSALIQGLADKFLRRTKEAPDSRATLPPPTDSPSSGQ